MAMLQEMLKTEILCDMIYTVLIYQIGLDKLLEQTILAMRTCEAEVQTELEKTKEKINKAN